MTKATTFAILVVDDVPDVLDLLDSYLLANFPQARILVAKSGVEAIRILQREPVDLLLTDQRMPAMNGLDLIESARTLRPHIRTALMTAYDDPAIADRARALNVDHMFQKPFEPDALGSTVRQLIQAKPSEGAASPRTRRGPATFEESLWAPVEGALPEILGPVMTMGGQDGSPLVEPEGHPWPSWLSR